MYNALRSPTREINQSILLARPANYYCRSIQSLSVAFSDNKLITHARRKIKRRSHGNGEQCEIISRLCFARRWNWLGSKDSFPERFDATKTGRDTGDHEYLC